MAATIAKARGVDHSGRVKDTHRVGSERALVEAATWHTKVVAEVRADGSGYMEMSRDGKIVHFFDFRAEEE